MKRRALTAALAVAAALSGGCATVAAPGQATALAAGAATPADPWENWNRKVFAFNEGLDAAVVKPVAQTYRKVVPSLVRTGVDNVFANVGDVWSATNHLLQGKVQNALEMGMRVLTNTLFGLGGVLDPATEMKLDRRSEDLGQTLGVWGVGHGAYLVLPVIGPSSVRDTVSFGFDRHFSATRFTQSSAKAWSLTGLEFLGVRTNLLATTALIDQVALDRYVFVREAYLSRRRDALYDGAPPLEEFDDEAGESAAPAPAKAPR